MNENIYILKNIQTLQHLHTNFKIFTHKVKYKIILPTNNINHIRLSGISGKQENPVICHTLGVIICH